MVAVVVIMVVGVVVGSYNGMARTRTLVHGCVLLRASKPSLNRSLRWRVWFNHESDYPKTKSVVTCF